MKDRGIGSEIKKFFITPNLTKFTATIQVKAFIRGARMNKNELTEYADHLFKTAMFKVNNIEDAEDLVQETLMAALSAINRNIPINDPKNWLITVLHRKYYDMLRRKYRKGTVNIDMIGDIPIYEDISLQLEQSEDAENIRRCLAHLTDLYRQVMVRFYMHGESVKQIAAALGIPENTVKSRLDTGRKHIRKDMTMENYTKQSYEPETLWITNSGRTGLNSEPFTLVGDDRIKMNLLILAYENPVTLPELAKAIGISTTYIEPIVNKLVQGELMKRVSDKFYTDFIIYSEHDRTVDLELEAELAKQLYKGIWEIAKCGLDELHEQDFYKSLSCSQSVKLDSFLVVRMIQDATNNIRNEACGDTPCFENFPDRPNGGKWYAMGNRYPANYDWNKNTYNSYCISGVQECTLGDYCGAKWLMLGEYDCRLGETYNGYCGGRVMYKMSGMDVMKMLYAIHSGNEDTLPIINSHCFENIDGLKALGFLSNDESGRVICDVPVITKPDCQKLYDISEKYDNMISEKYHDELMKLMKYPVKLPAHLRSVPNWQRYMYSCNTFPMRVIMNAHGNGLFLSGRDLKKKPAPAVFLAISK